MKKTLLYTICLWALFSCPGQALAKYNISHYVTKYENLPIDPSYLGRLEQYQQLISYFTSLEYFKPRHLVHPDFLKALIIAESSVNADARSVKNAIGLTQIIYYTAFTAAKELADMGYRFKYINHKRLRHLTPDDLRDPAINILLSCYLIAKYNMLFDGRLDLVVAAWNAGEHSVKNNAPPPYQETYELIGKVNGYYLSLLNNRQRN